MYVKVTNGTPEIYTIGQLRRDNSNTSFPKVISDVTLASYDVFPLSPTEQPSHDYTKSVVEGTPVQVNGVWTQVWSVSDASSEKIQIYNDKMSSLNRDKRGNKLAETDFYALSDVTMSAEVTAYRQALRDITSHANWPHLDEADWPTKP
mgnify:CR=1 FL=1